MAPDLVVHMTRFGGPVNAIYKELALAEGGQVPRDDWNLLKSFSRVIDVIGRAQRPCCPADNFRRVQNFMSWIPWHITANPGRWNERFRIRW